MINEIYPNQLSTAYDSNKAVEKDDYVFHYSGKSIVLMGDDTQAVVPQRKDFGDSIKTCSLIYMFSLNEQNCFLCMEKPFALPVGLTLQDIDVFRRLPQEIGWSIILGFHLHNWYQNHQYCGRCGAATDPGANERSIICKACNTTVYPTISPAIIVAITCGDKILLARGNHFPPGRFSLVAGYVDVGETLEEAVIREVKEEVGLDVTNIRYYKNHPWPLSGSIMVGFIAETDDQQTIEIDHNEIAEADWFSRHHLPEHYSATISISGEMIDKFRKGEL
ncbi:NAD(+) diphosphatase [Carboxylicivirga mesophila]|uniref:NAD(+) diphosphatase n=1 Tax=Carboxylicivirga mesophila TaxID=1166478 RepID=A0ABS5KB43_9BACT|nr:NAD(+) diphosphatase [Carboxylicivirga mesophila]MBS2212097.1 NAD(+) diphosphatase [Carboxylicivirga mesophila]